MMCLSSPVPPRVLGSEPDRVGIEVEIGAGTTTVFISGELDLATMPFVSEQLALVGQTSPERLVLDLTRTGFLDCGAARMIVATGRFLPAGQRLVIRRPNPGIRRILELTGLDAHCEIEA
jgi:anti-sigma B factor antagonist